MKPGTDFTDIVSDNNDGLQQIVDHNAPSVKRRVRDLPSAPGMSEEVREASRQCQKKCATIEEVSHRFPPGRPHQEDGGCEVVCPGSQEAQMP